jgi:hypothetical protein
MGLNVGESHNNWLNQVGTKPQANPPSETGREPGPEGPAFLHQDKGYELNMNKMPVNNSPAFIEIFGPDPKSVVDDIRNAPDQNAKNKGLVEFQSKIDKMSSKDLAVTRDYIISIMEDPTNRDDDMLFILLKTVNKKLDAEHFNPGKIINPIRITPDVLGPGPKIMFD